MKPIARVTVGIVALGAFLIPATTASADPGVCGQVITTPGTVVTLTGNLYCDGTAITVKANNVTIDLAGFTIKGAGTDPGSHPVIDPREDGYAVGIDVIGAKATTITGGTVHGFDVGILADNATALLITNATITHASLSDVWATKSDGIRVEKSKISGPWVAGEPVDPAEETYGASGLWIEDSSGLTVLDSTLTGLRGTGVHTTDVTELAISGSELVDNAGDGVHAWATGGTFAVRDTIIERNSSGIQFGQTIGTSQITIDGVSASKNRENGVIIDSPQRVNLSKVEASGNGQTGIWIIAGFASPPTAVATVADSRANDNGLDGIAVSGPSGTWTLTNNSSSGNHGFGFIADQGSLTSSRNIAKGNHADGFLWEDGLNGTSTSDVASGNLGNGVTVNVGSGNAMTLTDLVSTSGKAYGLLVKSGSATVVRGNFGVNSLDGIRVTAGGTGKLSYAHVAKNSANGIAYLAGSSGSAHKVKSTQNGRYGLCTASGASYRDYPPNTLTYNGWGPRGHTCDSVFIPWWF